MTAIHRRTLFAVAVVASMTPFAPASAVDALPDARFVGFAQSLNDFQIKAGQLAMQRSSDPLIRGYASRAITEHTTDAQTLRHNRSEAGVAYAPDGSFGPMVDNTLARLNGLQGPAFDTAYAQAQVTIGTAAVDQLGAYSQNGDSAPLRRYAQQALPRSKALLDDARKIAAGR